MSDILASTIHTFSIGIITTYPCCRKLIITPSYRWRNKGMEIDVIRLHSTWLESGEVVLTQVCLSA